MSVKLSIVILNYKSYGLLKNCLLGLKQYSPSFPHEIIVIDASSNSNKLKKTLTDVYQNKLPDYLKTIGLDKNIGYARANNIGLKQAVGEYIMILNPDTVIFKNTLDKLINFMDQDPRLGIVGPQILNPDKSIQDSCFRFPSLVYPLYRRTSLGNTTSGQKWLDWFLMKDIKRDHSFEVDWLLGACIVVRRKALDDVGVLDERFFLFLEDTDWCYRFWQQGWKVVYFPESKIVHYPNRASSEIHFLKHLFKKTAWIHLFSWVKFYKKNVYSNQEYKSLR